MKKIYLLKFFILIAFLDQSIAQSILLDGVQVSWFRYKMDTDLTNFTVQSALSKNVTPNDAWLGVGISDKPDIDGAHFFICRYSLSVIWIRHYVVAGDNQVLLKDSSNQSLGLSNPAVSVVSDILRCSFTVDNQKAYYDDVNYTQAYIIVAYGSGAPTTVDSNKAVSKTRLFFNLRFEATTTSIPTSTTTQRTSSTTTTTTTTTRTTSTTSTTTRSTTTPPCINFNNTLCDFYVSTFKGECQSYSYINGIALTTFCCKSCNCVDFQPNCVFWADRCNELLTFSPHPCRKTCKVCT